MCSSSVCLGRNPEPDPRPSNSGRKNPPEWAELGHVQEAWGLLGGLQLRVFHKDRREETALKSVTDRSEGGESESQSSVRLKKRSECRQSSSSSP